MRRHDGFFVQYLVQVRSHELGAGTTDRGSRRVRLSYALADPFAVNLEIAEGETLVRWLLARELLEQGRYRGVGLGDVHVCPAVDQLHSRVSVILRSVPGLGFELLFRRSELDDALRGMEQLVPHGAEASYISWGRELAVLRGGETR